MSPDLLRKFEEIDTIKKQIKKSSGDISYLALSGELKSMNIRYVLERHLNHAANLKHVKSKNHHVTSYRCYFSPEIIIIINIEIG